MSTKTTIRPLNDFVLVKPSEPEKTTSGGIIIVDTARVQPTEGTVISVGLGKKLDNGTRRKPEVEAGCTVLYNMYAGNEVDIDGIKHRIMREEEIFAVLPPKAPKGA